MAKYRGKNNGVTRGKYLQKEYSAVSKTREELYKMNETINEFLSNMGMHVSSCCFVDKWDNSKKIKYSYTGYTPYTKYSDTYHLAGATIGVDSYAYEKQPRANPQFQTFINIVSNDSLNDVCDKILNRFSMFE